MISRAWVLLFLGLVLGGCATGGQSSAQGEDPTRVRCVSEVDPRGRGSFDRPLIFLLCIQSP